MNIKEKVHLALTTAAVADAMAMPLLTRPTYLIKQDYGEDDYLFNILKSLDDAPGRGQKKATVTDVFLTVFMLLKSFTQNQKVSEKGVEDVLLEWSKNSQHFYAFADLSDKMAVQKLRGNYNPSREDAIPCEFRHRGASGAVRAIVAGLLNPNNPSKAIKDAVIITMCTHPNAVVVSGGAAIAGAIAAAFSNKVTISDILDVAYKSLRKGYYLGEKYRGFKSVGSKIDRRMELAINIGIKNGHDFDKCISEMAEVIGTGSYASESVPSAFGFFVAANGNAEMAVKMALNAGNCCNYTATIAGVLSAVFSGKENIFSNYIEEVETANGLVLESINY